MRQISVYIIAYNEAEKVAATIESAKWADEIIVVDSHSTDGTQDIATRLGARVVQVEFKGFGDLRNKAIAACTHDWIFSIDADERCTPEVAAEVRAIANDADALDVWRVPRRNYFMGRWIRHSGWYPNFRQPQFFRKGKMSYDLKPVHEGYVLHTDKPIGTLGSSADGKALALLRTDRASEALDAGLSLTADGVAVRIAVPDDIRAPTKAVSA